MQEKNIITNDIWNEMGDCMLEALRKINMKTAVFMGMCFYSLTILIHVLIISGIIPFTWVNGGRSESYRYSATDIYYQYHYFYYWRSFYTNCWRK